MLSSRSEEVEPSKEQSSSEHFDVNRAVGGWLTAGTPSAGRSNSVQLVAELAPAFAVAVRLPVVGGEPAIMPAPGSVSSVPIRPPPEPVVVARAVSPSGADHRVVALFLSDQYDTRQPPVVEFDAMGVVCAFELPGSGSPVIETSGASVSRPRYAARVSAT